MGMRPAAIMPRPLRFLDTPVDITSSYGPGHSTRTADRSTRRLERNASSTAIDEAADRLRNSRAIPCRESYIHPALPAAFLEGELAETWKSSFATKTHTRAERTVMATLAGAWQASAGVSGVVACARLRSRRQPRDAWEALPEVYRALVSPGAALSHGEPCWGRVGRWR